MPAAALALLLGACPEPVPKADADNPKAAPPVTKAANPPAPVIAVHSEPSLYGNYLAGLHARAQNDSAAGARFMDRVLARDSNNAIVLEAAFLLNLQDGAVARALPKARELQKSQATDQLVNLTLISGAIKQGDFAEAKRLIDAIGDEGLGDLLKPLLGAWVEVGLGKFDAALTKLEPLSKRKPFQPFLTYHRALITSLAGRNELADQYFTALLGDSENRPIRAALAFGQFLETIDQYPRAASVYTSFQRPVQPHPVLTAALAQNAARQPAVLLVKDAAEGAAETLYSIASVLTQESGQNLLPLIYLRLAAYIKPDFEETLLLTTGLLEGLKRHDEAIAIYARFPESSPHFETAHIQIALNEDQAGREEAAVDSLRRYVEKYPGKTSQALVSLADLLRSHDRFAEAIPVYDKVIAAIGDPKQQHWPMLYARGITQERAGNWQHAERDLLLALELEPDQPNVLNYLAYSWIDKGLNLERAKTMIENAASQRPDDGAIIDSLGWIQYRTGDFGNAVETLESAIRLMPQDAVINDHLGDAYWRVGRKLEAKFQWQRALSFDPDANVKSGIEKKLQNGLDSGQILPAPVESSAQKS